MLFRSNDTATTEIYTRTYTLSLHDALPIYPGHLWHDNSHSNELVPAWIRGVNASVFAKLVDGKDPVRGPYIDEVDLGQVMMKSVDAAKPGE